MPSNPVEFAWGPGFIGFVISLGLYGISIAQTVFYVYTFPEDSKWLKILVATLLVLDTLHVAFVTGLFQVVFIEARFNMSRALAVPWQAPAEGMIMVVITSIAQIFYMVRIWRLSERNRTLIIIIAFLGALQFGGGTAFSITVLIGLTQSQIYTNQTPLTTQLLSGCLCDVLITGSLVYYLYSKKTDIPRTETILQKVIFYTVNIGLIGCVVTFVSFILLHLKTRNYSSIAPHLILGKCYVNSVLTSLNIRKSLREMFQFEGSLTLPTTLGINPFPLGPLHEQVPRISRTS